MQVGRIRDAMRTSPDMNGACNKIFRNGLGFVCACLFLCPSTLHPHFPPPRHPYLEYGQATSTRTSLPPSMLLTHTHEAIEKGTNLLEDRLDERVDLGATSTGIAALDEMRLLLLISALFDDD